MWYVGLDWADTHHDVEVLDEAGKRVGVRRFAHSHDGLNELQAFLLGIAASPEDLACIVETNKGMVTLLLERKAGVRKERQLSSQIKGIACYQFVFRAGSPVDAWNRRVRPVKGASGIRSKSIRCNCANGNVASASLAASMLALSNINTTLPGSLARV